jgi:hypothetical protein
MSNINTSENQENIEASTSENKFNYKQYKVDIYFIMVPTLCIILLLSGIMFYICGRINFTLAFIPFILPWVLLAIFVFFLVNIVRLIRKNTLKKRFLILFEICLPILLVLLFVILRFNFNLWGSKNPFLCGYRDQITRKIDIDEVQIWMKTFSDKHFTTDKGWINKENISDNEYPETLKKKFYPVYYLLRTDEYGNPVIDFNRGGGFFHWGFVIGTKDMAYSESEINEMEKRDEFWIKVQSGFYVYAQY